MAKFDRYAPFEGSAPAASDAKPADRYAPFTPTATSSDTAPEESSSANLGAIAAGAAVGYGANKFFPLDPIDSQAKNRAAKLKDELSGLRAQGSVAASQLEAARKPFLLAQASNTINEAEFVRNRALMEAVTKRAMELGVEPKSFLSGSELFQRAMSPEMGFGTTNYVNAMYKNVNPIIESRIESMGDAKPVMSEYKSTEPLARQVVGTTVQTPKGILTPIGRGAEVTRAGMELALTERALLEAHAAFEASRAAEQAAQAAIDPKLAPAVDRLERQVAGSRAEMLAAQKAVPSVAEKIASVVSSPKVGAGLGALSAYKLPQAYEEYMRGNYRDALLHGLEGVSGGLMLAPHSLLKAAGMVGMAVPMAYEYGPLAYDAIKKGFNYFNPKQ